MPDQSPILSLPYIMPAQAQKHVTHNESIRLLDVLVQLVVEDRDRSAPNEAPLEGSRHIVGAGATGDWIGREGQIAVWQDSAWSFVAPKEGWRCFVRADSQTAIFDGVGWVLPSENILRAAQLGVGATPDAVNRLAISSPAILANHAGAGVQLKLNKASVFDTASLLFQTGFSGRAEMGIVGDDNFQIKVSPDGSTFFTSLVCSAADGRVAAPNGIEANGPLTGSGVVGTVSQSLGVSTGSVIERGEGPTGDYVRFADGTQICTTQALAAANVAAPVGALFRSATVTWTFPQAFSAPPVVSAMAQSSSAWVVGEGAPAPSAAALRVVSAISESAGQPLSAIAVGRWY